MVGGEGAHKDIELALLAASQSLAQLPCGYQVGPDCSQLVCTVLVVLAPPPGLWPVYLFPRPEHAPTPANDSSSKPAPCVSCVKPLAEVPDCTQTLGLPLYLPVRRNEGKDHSRALSHTCQKSQYGDMHVHRGLVHLEWPKIAQVAMQRLKVRLNMRVSPQQEAA